MFRYAAGKIVTFCVFMMLSVGIAFYIHEKNRPAPEPIKIYKVVQPLPKQEKPTKLSSVDTTLLEFATIEAPATEHNHPSYVHSHDDHSEEPFSTKPSAGSDVTNNVLPITDEKSLSDVEIEEWVTSVTKMLEDLDRKFMEKYPEAIQISYMTKEEFFEAYPTPESQQALAERMKRVQPEIFGELRAVYSALPVEIVDDILSITKERLIQTIGYDTADLIIRQLRRELEL